MNRDRYQRACEIFLELVDLPAEQIEQRLRTFCERDGDLLREVEEMLSGDRLAEGRLPTEGVSRIIVDTGDEEEPPDVPGFDVERNIGSGGFGEVWLARQITPVDRRVAVKVLKRGIDTVVVLRRFRSEQQALARMRHPYVAQVFDAGETLDGRPYFVMEYVDGLPINEFCDQRRLGLAARLSLFTRVCRGIQHAHRRLIRPQIRQIAGHLPQLAAGPATLQEHCRTTLPP